MMNNIDGYGIVIAVFNSPKNKEGASAIVYEDHRSPLFVIPRRLFDVEKLKSEGLSKSQINKLSQELDIGANIHFQAVGNQIQSYQKLHKDQSDKFEDKFEVIGWKCVAMRVKVIISDEEPRRFYCYDFEDGHQFSIPNREMQKVLPNVLYVIYVHINLDFGGYQPDTEPSDRCHPTYTITFGRWFCALDANFEEIGRAPWNLLPINHQVRHEVRQSYTILASEPLPYTKSQCLVIDGKELWCPLFPDRRCVLALINRNEVTLVSGRFLHCDMFFSYHNNAYVVYNYWHGNGDCGIEDPMQVRVTKEGRDFLAYAKLNRFGHFYCSASIPLIGDPKNILHGYVKLGDDNDMIESEYEQGIGIPVWVRYLEKKTNEQSPARFEIVSLAEKMYHVNSQGQRIKLEKSLKTPFTSTGLLLNKRGTVYCPNVCNFPIVWTKPKLEVGTLFKFHAEFSKSAQKYKVVEMLGIEQKFPYETIKLATEDDSYAFRVPLKSNMNFTASLLVDHERMGLMEDLTGDIAAYGRAMEYLSPDRHLMVWCRENPDLERRITPLFCMQFEQPEGELISRNKK